MKFKLFCINKIKIIQFQNEQLLLFYRVVVLLKFDLADYYYLNWKTIKFSY